MMHKKLKNQLLKQMVTLSTSGLGLVAALAWNEAIQGFVDDYVARYASVGSGIVSKFIYAIIITALAVLITYQLTRLAGEDDHEDSKDK